MLTQVAARRSSLRLAHVAGRSWHMTGWRLISNWRKKLRCSEYQMSPLRRSSTEANGGKPQSCQTRFVRPGSFRRGPIHWIEDAQRGATWHYNHPAQPESPSPGLERSAAVGSAFLRLPSPMADAIEQPASGLSTHALVLMCRRLFQMQSSYIF
jgi:hypothetical protein